MPYRKLVEPKKIKEVGKQNASRQKLNIQNYRWVKNKSGLQFSEEKMTLMNRGLKHSICQKQLPVVDIINDLELAAPNLPKEKQESFKHESKKIKF